MADKKDIRIDNAFLRQSHFGNSPELTFAGATSFARRRYTKDLQGVDVAITGIPFDCATTNRPGARFGPRQIREMSALLVCAYLFDLRHCRPEIHRR
ncbi:MAG: arginase family protein [Pseudomonadota bacterium]